MNDMITALYVAIALVVTGAAVLPILYVMALHTNIFPNVSQWELNRALAYPEPPKEQSQADRYARRIERLLIYEKDKWTLDAHCARYYKTEPEEGRLNYNSTINIWISGLQNIHPDKPIDRGRNYWTDEQKERIADLVADL